MSYKPAISAMRRVRRLQGNNPSTNVSVTNLTAPALAASQSVGVQQAITQATWSGSIQATRFWHIRSSAYTNGERQPVNTAALYTPESFMSGQDVYVVEEVQDANGVSYFSTSATVTVAQAVTALTTTQLIASKSVVQNSGFTPFIPVSSSGGTGTRTASASLVPAGMTFTASTGEFGGVPTGTLSATVITVTWTDSATPTPAQSSQTFTLTITADPLDAMVYPVQTAVSNFSGTYDGVTAMTLSGAVHLGPTADPGGSGLTVNIHRVSASYATISGGKRSETLWIDLPAYRLDPAIDHWLAFAFWRKAGEAIVTGSAQDDTMLVFQTHTPFQGSTQPDIALFLAGQGSGLMRMRRSYNASAPFLVNGVLNQSTTATVTLTGSQEALPATGQWIRCIVHYRPGWTTAQLPRIDMWRKLAADSDYVKKVDNDTGLNTYNNGGNNAMSSYPRIGVYAYNSTWSADPIAYYMTPLYYGQGTDMTAMYESAKAALAGLIG
jgi:hypothetical protein